MEICEADLGSNQAKLGGIPLGLFLNLANNAFSSALWQFFVRPCLLKAAEKHDFLTIRD
jgi:hypothetical protein